MFKKDHLDEMLAKMKIQNEALRQRHLEVEADKRLAASQKALVQTSPPKLTIDLMPAEKEAMAEKYLQYPTRPREMENTHMHQDTRCKGVNKGEWQEDEGNRGSRKPEIRTVSRRTTPKDLETNEQNQNETPQIVNQKDLKRKKKSRSDSDNATVDLGISVRNLQLDPSSPAPIFRGGNRESTPTARLGNRESTLRARHGNRESTTIVRRSNKDLTATVSVKTQTHSESPMQVNQSPFSSASNSSMFVSPGATSIVADNLDDYEDPFMDISERVFSGLEFPDESTPFHENTLGTPDVDAASAEALKNIQNIDFSKPPPSISPSKRNFQFRFPPPSIPKYGSKEQIKTDQSNRETQDCNTSPMVNAQMNFYSGVISQSDDVKARLTTYNELQIRERQQLRTLDFTNQFVDDQRDNRLKQQQLTDSVHRPTQNMALQDVDPTQRRQHLYRDQSRNTTIPSSNQYFNSQNNMLQSRDTQNEDNNLLMDNIHDIAYNLAYSDLSRNPQRDESSQNQFMEPQIHSAFSNQQRNQRLDKSSQNQFRDVRRNMTVQSELQNLDSQRSRPDRGSNLQHWTMPPNMPEDEQHNTHYNDRERGRTAPFMKQFINITETVQQFDNQQFKMADQFDNQQFKMADQFDNQQFKMADHFDNQQNTTKQHCDPQRPVRILSGPPGDQQALHVSRVPPGDPQRIMRDPTGALQRILSGPPGDQQALHVSRVPPGDPQRMRDPTSALQRILSGIPSDPQALPISNVPQNERQRIIGGLPGDAHCVVRIPSGDPHRIACGPPGALQCIMGGPTGDPQALPILSVPPGDRQRIMAGPTGDLQRILSGLPGDTQALRIVSEPNVDPQRTVRVPTGDAQRIASGPPCDPQRFVSGPPGDAQRILSGPPGDPQLNVSGPPGDPQRFVSGPPGDSQRIVSGPSGDPRRIVSGPNVDSQRIVSGPSGEPQRILSALPGDPRALRIVSEPNVDSHCTASGLPGDPQRIVSGSSGDPHRIVSGPPGDVQRIVRGPTGDPYRIVSGPPGDPQRIVSGQSSNHTFQHHTTKVSVPTNDNLTGRSQNRFSNEPEKITRQLSNQNAAQYGDVSSAQISESAINQSSWTCRVQPNTQAETATLGGVKNIEEDAPRPPRAIRGSSQKDEKQLRDETSEDTSGETKNAEVPDLMKRHVGYQASGPGNMHSFPPQGVRFSTPPPAFQNLSMKSSWRRPEHNKFGDFRFPPTMDFHKIRYLDQEHKQTEFYTDVDCSNFEQPQRGRHGPNAFSRRQAMPRGVQFLAQNSNIRFPNPRYGENAMRYDKPRYVNRQEEQTRNSSQCKSENTSAFSCEDVREVDKRRQFAQERLEKQRRTDELETANSSVFSCEDVREADQKKQFEQEVLETERKLEESETANSSVFSCEDVREVDKRRQFAQDRLEKERKIDEFETGNLYSSSVFSCEDVREVDKRRQFAQERLEKQRRTDELETANSSVFSCEDVRETDQKKQFEQELLETERKIEESANSSVFSCEDVREVDKRKEEERLEQSELSAFSCDNVSETDLRPKGDEEGTSKTKEKTLDQECFQNKEEEEKVEREVERIEASDYDSIKSEDEEVESEVQNLLMRQAQLLRDIEKEKSDGRNAELQLQLLKEEKEKLIKEQNLKYDE